MRECTEIRAQLSLSEDKYDNAYAQLQETMRKLKECEYTQLSLNGMQKTEGSSSYKLNLALLL